MALSDNGQSTRKLIFSRGDFFLKPGATLQMYQIKLHSYRVRVQGVIIKKRNLLSLTFNMINVQVNTYFSYMLVILIKRAGNMEI